MASCVIVFGCGCVICSNKDKMAYITEPHNLINNSGRLRLVLTVFCGEGVEEPSGL